MYVLCMAKYKVVCEGCGYSKLSQYKHTVCPNCRGAMHYGIMPNVIVQDLKQTLKLMGEKQ